MPWVERRGDTWLVRAWHDNHKFTDSSHPSETHARLRLLQLHNTELLARAHKPGPAPTLAEWATRWLGMRQIDATTADNYRTHLRLYLLPELGALHLEQIDPPAVIRLIRRLQAKPLGAAIVRNVITLLGTMLRDACRTGYLAHDPTAGIRIPRPSSVARLVLSPAQVLAIADRMPTTRLHVMVITAAYTGMRPGETAALQPHNLHHGDPGSLRLPYLSIDPDAGSRHELHGRRWLGPVKTANSARHVFLPPFLHQLLTDIAPVGGDGPLFTLADRELLPRRAFNTLWRLACDGDDRHRWPSINPGMRYYQLRHNHRAWMDEDTIDETVQATRLGHRHPAHRLPLRRLAALQLPLLDALERRWLDGSKR